MWPTFYIPGVGATVSPPPPPGDYCTNFPVGSDTWTKPAGLTWVEVTVVGGGGGGGSGAAYVALTAHGGQGGGGGELRKVVFKASDLPDTVSITVGDGGAGGASVSSTGSISDGNIGQDGEDSSFGTYVTARAGRAGAEGRCGSVSPVYDNGGGTADTIFYSGGAYYSFRGQSGQQWNTSIQGTQGSPRRAGAGGGGGGGEFIQGTGGVAASDGSPSPDGTVAGGVAGATDFSENVASAGLPPLDHASDAGAGGGGGGGGGYLFPQRPGGVGWAGGDGGDFGGGGGGGGATTAFNSPASVSGPGGAGARGVVRVCHYFAWEYDYAARATTGYTYDDSTTYRVLRTTGIAPWPSVARPVGHPQYDNVEFWVAEYEAAVAAGTVTAGWVYGLEYPVTQAFGYKKAW